MVLSCKATYSVNVRFNNNTDNNDKKISSYNKFPYYNPKPLIDTLSIRYSQINFDFMKNVSYYGNNNHLKLSKRSLLN